MCRGLLTFNVVSVYRNKQSWKPLAFSYFEHRRYGQNTILRLVLSTQHIHGNCHPYAADCHNHGPLPFPTNPVGYLQQYPSTLFVILFALSSFSIPFEVEITSVTFLKLKQARHTSILPYQCSLRAIMCGKQVLTYFALAMVGMLARSLLCKVSFYFIEFIHNSFHMEAFKNNEFETIQ